MEVSWGEWWHNGLFDGIFNCNKMEVNECFGQLGCPFQPWVSTWTTWPITWDDWLRFSAGWHHDIPILLVKRQNTQHTLHVFKLLASFVSMYYVLTYIHTDVSSIFLTDVIDTPMIYIRTYIYIFTHIIHIIIFITNLFRFVICPIPVRVSSWKSDGLTHD